MNKDDILKITDVEQTPFYLYDITLLNRTIRKVNEYADKYGYKIHYALKANFDERISEIISGYGWGADCVSGNEVLFSIKHGFSPSEIVFAGVGKTDKEIADAIDNDIYCFNCESAQEFFVINKISASKGKVSNIALRINPDIDPNTHRYISTGQKESKFGISYDEIREILLNYKVAKNVKIVGIHFHIGSQIRDLSVYENLCRKVNDAILWFEEQGVSLTDINVGGGLGINYSSPDEEPIADFDAYFSIFNSGLRLKPNQKLHFELGRSIVGQCGSLITRVLFHKKIASGKSILIIDAGMTDLLRPALYQAQHEIDCLTASGKDLKNYTIGGPVCESSDIFRYNIMLPKLERGDILAIRSAGAYGMSMASSYNLRNLPKAFYID